MRFGHLENLWLFISEAVVVIAGICIGLYFYRKRLFKIAGKGVVYDFDPYIFIKLYLRKVLLFVGALFVGFSLLAPRWGYEWKERKRKGIDIFIAIDVSKSMLCEDVKPNRLKRAIMEVKSLLQKIEGGRVGLIVFAGEAYIKCPLTYDLSALNLFLDDISVENIPKGGTSLSSAIKLAVNHIPDIKSSEKLLIVLSDGEDHYGKLEESIDLAKKNNLKIFSVAIGTERGGPILIETGGKKKYIKDKKGNIVITKVEKDILKKISIETNGAFAVSSDRRGFQLAKIYDIYLSKLKKEEYESDRFKKYKERYNIFASLGLLFLIMSFFLEGGRRL